LAHKLDEEKIFKKLRTGQFLNKLKRWPVEILSAELAISDESMAKLELFYEVRGDLTHPKTGGHDIYSRLDTIDPEAVLIPVAEYIVRFYEAHLEVFPYWLFGWNYLNPRPDTHEIIVINNQQFSHSMNNLGFKVPAWDAGSADAWRKKNMTTFDGYLKIKDCLETVDGCEAKVERFPFQPKLCRRWWTEEHHRSCGHVTQSALERALELDR
jgi:hypothetical protein